MSHLSSASVLTSAWGGKHPRCSGWPSVIVDELLSSIKKFLKNDQWVATDGYVKIFAVLHNLLFVKN